MSVLNANHPLRNNIVARKSKDKPGLRINWLNATLSIVLLIAGGYAMNLRDNNHDLFTGASLAGFFSLVVLGILFAALKSFSNINDERWPVWAGAVIGAAIVSVIIWLIAVNHTELKAVFAGVITYGIIATCIIGISVTKWWPNGRPSKNRDEL